MASSEGCAATRLLHQLRSHTQTAATSTRFYRHSHIYPSHIYPSHIYPSNWRAEKNALKTNLHYHHYYSKLFLIGLLFLGTENIAPKRTNFLQRVDGIT